MYQHLIKYSIESFDKLYNQFLILFSLLDDDSS